MNREQKTRIVGLLDWILNEDRYRNRESVIDLRDELLNEIENDASKPDRAADDKYMRAELILGLKAREGYREMPYRDTEGHWTVGYGHLLTGRVQQTLPPFGEPQTFETLLGHITNDRQHARWLESDLDDAIGLAQQWLVGIFDTLDGARQEVVIEMCFQLGASVRDFKRMRAALAETRYATAASEMLWQDAEAEPREPSAWQRQTPERCKALAMSMETGHRTGMGRTPGRTPAS